MRRRLLVLALSLAALACSRAKAPAPAAPPKVVVTPVVQRDEPIVREWIGTTEGDVNADIRPHVEGYLLRRVYKEGSTVAQGELLFEIDPRQFEAQLQQAQANLEQAKAALAKADLDVARAEPLATDHAVSQQELDNARSGATRRAGDRRRPRGGRRAGEAQPVVDPGHVADPGDRRDRAAAGRRPRQRTDGPHDGLEGRSPARPLPARRAGIPRAPARSGHAERASSSSCSRTAAPSRTRGTCSSRGATSTCARGRSRRIGLFPNPGNALRPGQYAKVRAVVKVRKGAILVPQRAVNEMQGAYQVAVVGADDKAQIRTVKAAERIGNMWVIESGLSPGERVVVEGFSRVKTGATVAPVDAASAAPSATAAPPLTGSAGK